MKNTNKWLLIKAFYFLEKMIIKNSLVGSSSFFDNSWFPWIPFIEENIPVMKEEMERVLTRINDLPNFQDISIEQQYVTRGEAKWKIFPFIAYGVNMAELETDCPKTTQLLQHIPGIKTAMYSILLPNFHVPIHRGPYRGVLRLHIPLKLPTNPKDCKIEVGNEVRCWEENKCLIFDDGLLHQVWNNSEEIRVVIFIDFLRPLRFPWHRINQHVVKLISKTNFIQRAADKSRKWHQERWRQNEN